MTKIIKNTLQKALIGLFFLGLTARSYALLGGTLPSIAVQPVGVTVQNGGTAVIAVVPAPNILNATLTYTWFYNNQPATNSNITILNVTTNSLLGIPLGNLIPISILTVNNANVTNVGNYSVHLKNAIGTTISSNATLIVLSSVVTNLINFVSSATNMTATGFNLHLTTPTGSNVVVEASTDLTNWTPIYTNLDSTGSVSFTDTGATNYSHRYYRAHTQ